MISQLRRAICEQVDEKAANGEVVDVDRLASALASKHPQSGMTIDEIAQEIERSAVRARATLLSGASSLPPTS